MHVLCHYVYVHPVLSIDAVRAMRFLAPQRPVAEARIAPEGPETVVWHRAFALAGAWTRYGFHDDGFVCSRCSAALPCVASPFAIADADHVDAESGEPRVGVMTRLFVVLEVVRAFAVPLVIVKATG